jgi:protein-L-isoaspartate(D-aspartate) O-methyltransferase
MERAGAGSTYTVRRSRADGPARLVEAAREQGVVDERVLQALADTPREQFVPPELRHAAYRDRPVPLPHGQTTSQPSLVAQMVEALDLDGSSVALEIGTGYGYQTALLARLAGRVVSIERDPELAEVARANLARAGVDADVRVGDGTEGAPDAAPFDGIVVSAAFRAVPPPLAEQLAEGGRLVMPIGGSGYDEVILYLHEEGGLVTKRMLTGARFVPLTGRYGFPER